MYDQNQSIRRDYYLIGILVIGGWGNWTPFFSPALSNSLSLQTENVLIIFCQQIIITFSTRICNSKHKITFSLVIKYSMFFRFHKRQASLKHFFLV